MPSGRLIDAHDREAIAQLQFFAQNVVEGISAGLHRSPLQGASVEFKEHRQYVRGDEIRSIDWKLFGKTDRLFIRQYEDETNLRAMLLLDQSGSMGYRGSRSPLSKHAFAVRLAACFATLLISQQDAVGLTTSDERVRETLPVRGQPQHLRNLFHYLVQSQPGRETGLAQTLRQVAPRQKQRGLWVLLSDCFEQIESLVAALRSLRHAGHEVVVFQIWDPDELDFPFRQKTEFRSLEATGQHLVEPRVLRDSYLQRVREFREQLDLALAAERINLIACTTTQPYSEVLAQFLARRRNVRRDNAAGARR